MAIEKINENTELEFNKQAYHILQTTHWAKFLKKQKRDVETVVDTKNNLGFLISFNNVPWINKKIAYLQKSAIPTKDLIEYIKGKKNVFYIKCEPQALDNEENLNSLKSLGFKKSNWNIFLPYTFFIDLTKSINEIYSNFNQNTKRNINKAVKKGIEIEERNDKKAIEIFLSLNAQTTKRQVYFTHSDKYYNLMWEEMTKDERAIMLLAKSKGEYIACIILFHNNGFLYYPYGASLRDVDGSSAMALLHFDAIKRSKGEVKSILNDKNLNTYDLWGSLGSDEDTNDPLYGVHRFKKGFGGNLIHFVPSYDYIINPFYYYPFKWVSSIRKKYYKTLKIIKRK